MTPERDAELSRLEAMLDEMERQPPPEDFDHRGCRAVLAMLAAFWIAAFGAADWYFGWNAWAWACGALTGTR